MKKVQEKNSDPADSGLFISRELSWIDFNARVLDEAGCAANPVLERLKFIAIFSSNLDEFFMVRIAGLRQLVKMGQDLPDPAGNRPSEQLARMRKKLDRLLKRQHDCLMDEILPELGRRGVKLVRPADVAAPVRAELSSYFRGQVLPVLTPLAVDSAHPFPILNSGSIEIAVSMRPAGRSELVYAFVEVPELLPRFIEVPDNQPGRSFMLLEELIMDNLGTLFTGCGIEEYFPFRITRDMDFSVEDNDAEDLMQSIEKKLLQRRHREPDPHRAHRRQPRAAREMAGEGVPARRTVLVLRARAAAPEAVLRAGRQGAAAGTARTGLASGHAAGILRTVRLRNDFAVRQRADRAAVPLLQPDHPFPGGGCGGPGGARHQADALPGQRQLPRGPGAAARGRERPSRSRSWLS